MKYRRDFVTNSSSSSFIISFKSKKDMEEQFKKMCSNYPQYANIVFEDIKKNKKTYGEILKEYKERLEWETYYTLKYNSPEYRDKSPEWFKSDEFKAIQKECIEKELEDFKNKVNHRGQFFKVTYSDHSDMGSELEHHIMPYMPFTVKVFSNH